MGMIAPSRSEEMIKAHGRSCTSHYLSIRSLPYFHLVWLSHGMHMGYIKRHCDKLERPQTVTALLDSPKGVPQASNVLVTAVQKRNECSFMGTCERQEFEGVF